MSERVVIVGANASGATCAAVLREEGFEGAVTLIGEEPLPPYERPPLSKEVLRGDKGGADTRFREDAFWSDRDIDLRLGIRVTSIDPGASSVTLADGEVLLFDRAVLATGVRPRPLDLPGADLAGVHLLRTAADAERIRHAAIDAQHAVVVGFGFIGSEVAAGFRTLGLDVTIVEPGSTALERVLGRRFGRALEMLHRDHGVRMRFEDAPRTFEGSGRVERVTTESGAAIETDLVVIGIGTVPNDDLAAAAGLATDRGILVDEALRTSNPRILAIGDVALHDHPLFGRIRVEHFDNAQKMGEHAARSLASGVSEPFTDPHWFWSDQYDSMVQMSGFTTDWGEDPVIRGSVEDRSFAAFRLGEAGELRAVVGLDANRDVRRSLKLIGLQIDPSALADPEVDLRTLVG